MDSIESSYANLFLVSFVPHLLWSYLFKTAHEEPPAGNFMSIFIVIFLYIFDSRMYIYT